MESALFQKRLRAMHVRTASKRREELELKVLSEAKNSKKKASNGSSSRSRDVLRYLSALIFGSSSPAEAADYYSRFGRADQLWEEEGQEEQQHGEARC